jgi:plasmid stability protein
MPSLTLKNLPDELLESLREAAERDRRSLTQEIIHLLDQAVRESDGQRSHPGFDAETQLAAWRRLAGRWQSDVDAKTESKRLMKRRTRGRDVDM